MNDKLICVVMYLWLSFLVH